MEVTLKTRSMAGKRDLSTAREWGREILKTHELQEYNSAPENALIPVLDVTQIQADAQPRKMTISGVVNSAIEAGIIDPAGGGGGLAAVVDDTTPQLGGDLDVNGQSIVSTSNQNVKVAPDGTGVTEFMGSAGNDAAIQLNCEVNTHGVKIKSPPHSAAANYTLTLPDTTGTSGQLMTTDGSGKLSFTTPATGLPTATTDGKALIVSDGEWVEGPVIGGVYYAKNPTGGTDYTVPTGFEVWQSTFSVQPSNQSGNVTLSNNDFTATATATSRKDFTSQTTKNSGKLYWEIKVLDLASTTTYIGLTTPGGSANNIPGGNGTGGVSWTSTGQAFNNTGGTYNGGQASYAANDVLMFAIDFSAKYYWVGKNGTWAGGGNPATGLNPTLENWTGTPDFYYAASADTNGKSAEVRSTYNAQIIDIPASDSFRTILGIGEYVDDAAAGTGGVASGSLYYNTTSNSYVLKS